MCLEAAQSCPHRGPRCTKTTALLRGSSDFPNIAFASVYKQEIIQCLVFTLFTCGRKCEIIGLGLDFTLLNVSLYVSCPCLIYVLKHILYILPM